MRRAGRVVREVLELVRSHVKPGATTLDLEKVAEARIKDRSASRRSLRRACAEKRSVPRAVGAGASDCYRL